MKSKCKPKWQVFLFFFAKQKHLCSVERCFTLAGYFSSYLLYANIFLFSRINVLSVKAGVSKLESFKDGQIQEKERQLLCSCTNL